MNTRPILSSLARFALPLAAALAPGAAQAQLYWQAPDLSGPPVTGAEAHTGVNLPGASPEELRAGLVWSLRAALNVAALQCGFEPTLLTASNYNVILAQHRTELSHSYATLSGYFRRLSGDKLGQKQLDQYGTRIYSGYSTVQAQRAYCQTAALVGREAVFAPKGGLYLLATQRLGELRRALSPQPDLAFGNPGYGFAATLPPLDKKCWKRGLLVRKCQSTWEKAASAAR